jgi:hypothetical protein
MKPATLTDGYRQPRLAAEGAVRTHRLPPAVRLELWRLLGRVIDRSLSAGEFELHWRHLPLEPAEGLPHLEALLRAYLAGETREADLGPNELLELIAVYEEQLESAARQARPRDLPLPAAAPQPSAADLPLPGKS